MIVEFRGEVPAHDTHSGFNIQHVEGVESCEIGVSIDGEEKQFQDIRPKAVQHLETGKMRENQ